MSEIRDGEDLWQWSPLEIRLNAFEAMRKRYKTFIVNIIARVMFFINRGVLLEGVDVTENNLLAQQNSLGN